MPAKKSGGRTVLWGDVVSTMERLTPKPWVVKQIPGVELGIPGKEKRGCPQKSLEEGGRETKSYKVFTFWESYVFRERVTGKQHRGVCIPGMTISKGIWRRRTSGKKKRGRENLKKGFPNITLLRGSPTPSIERHLRDMT